MITESGASTSTLMTFHLLPLYLLPFHKITICLMMWHKMIIRRMPPYDIVFHVIWQNVDWSNDILLKDFSFIAVSQIVNL